MPSSDVTGGLNHYFTCLQICCLVNGSQFVFYYAKFCKYVNFSHAVLFFFLLNLAQELFAIGKLPGLFCSVSCIPNFLSLGPHLKGHLCREFVIGHFLSHLPDNYHTDTVLFINPRSVAQAYYYLPLTFYINPYSIFIFCHMAVSSLIWHTHPAPSVTPGVTSDSAILPSRILSISGCLPQSLSAQLLNNQIFINSVSHAHLYCAKIVPQQELLLMSYFKNMFKYTTSCFDSNTQMYSV